MSTDARQFKVGDNVCDPVRHGNGVVQKITIDGRLWVEFEDKTNEYYNSDGRYMSDQILPSLYHGHMKEGSGVISFKEKRQPVYEWQWEYIYTNPRTNESHVESTWHHYKTEESMLSEMAGNDVKDFIRIERSKRLVKE